MDLGLHDRTFVVSGGSRGLGLATAQALVAEGARVVLVARTQQGLDTAVDLLGPTAVGMCADLADPQLGVEAVQLALDRFDRIDGGLISVGGPPAGTVMSTTDEQWQHSFDAVFLGSVRLARALVSGISDCGLSSTGSIACVLSTSAVELMPGLSTSNGLRPGLAMVVKDLADEVGPTGLRVNGLLPGRIATDRMAALDAASGDAAAARARSSAGIPLRRYGEPAEFGRVAAFVLSPAASYLTGSLIRVDGGATRSL